jgi:HSP20 family molecular chaperone IbpA
MSTMLPSDQNHQHKNKPEPFGELIKSMHDFFNEKPVKGFLQSIDDFFKNPFPPGFGFPVETVDNGKEYVVSAELPGIKREQIKLNIQGHLLTISIDNHQIELEEDEINQVFKQKQFRQYTSRTISLPQAINEKKIKASYRDGLLQIRIPQERGKIINIDD